MAEPGPPAGEQLPKTCDEMKAAIGKTGDDDKARQRLLIKQSVELGCVEHIPDSWEVDVNG